DLKLKGLHLHLGRTRIMPGDEHLAPLYDICEAYNRPIIFNAGMSWEPGSLAKYGRPIEYEELAATRPSLRICLSRFGWPWAEECAMLMVKYPNVYTDTGILYFDNAREFFDRLFKHEVALTWIDRSLRHQVMFGSNNPRFEQIRMAQALDGLGLRESTLELIKGGNAIEFLGGLD
nr:amidohydrolase family protein [Atopobiaceae bacterium]